jgi:formylmethanofuran dehydrogenase subunit E
VRKVITKLYGEYAVTCDVCGEIISKHETWQDAADAEGNGNTLCEECDND